MNILNSPRTHAAHMGRGYDELDRRITALALAVVFATIACTMIILFGSPQTRDAAFVQASYGA
jgi:hypothetical protein